MSLQIKTTEQVMSDLFDIEHMVSRLSKAKSKRQRKKRLRKVEASVSELTGYFMRLHARETEEEYYLLIND